MELVVEGGVTPGMTSGSSCWDAEDTDAHFLSHLPHHALLHQDGHV